MGAEFGFVFIRVIQLLKPVVALGAVVPQGAYFWSFFSVFTELGRVKAADSSSVLGIVVEEAGLVVVLGLGGAGLGLEKGKVEDFDRLGGRELVEAFGHKRGVGEVDAFGAFH